MRDSDESLLKSFALDRDEKAFRALAERYLGLIFHTALRTLGDRLADRGSRHATVFAALLAAGGERGLSKAIAARPVPGEENSPAAMDKVWMEEPVTFLDGPQPVKFYAKGARP